jgi:hypothetical protein
VVCWARAPRHRHQSLRVQPGRWPLQHRQLDYFIHGERVSDFLIRRRGATSTRWSIINRWLYSFYLAVWPRSGGGGVCTYWPSSRHGMMAQIWWPVTSRRWPSSSRWPATRRLQRWQHCGYAVQMHSVVGRI